MTIWQEWRRPSIEAVWALAAFALFFILLQSALLVDVHRAGDVLAKSLVIVLGLAYVLASGTLSYRVFVHARLFATPSGLIIRNPFRRNQEVAWSAITSMRTDRLLTIHAGDRRVIVWVIQKNGWARLKQHHTDADDAISSLELLAGRALGTGPARFAGPSAHGGSSALA